MECVEVECVKVNKWMDGTFSVPEESLVPMHGSLFFVTKVTKSFRKKVKSERFGHKGQTKKVTAAIVVDHRGGDIHEGGWQVRGDIHRGRATFWPTIEGAGGGKPKVSLSLKPFELNLRVFIKGSEVTRATKCGCDPNWGLNRYGEPPGSQRMILRVESSDALCFEIFVSLVSLFLILAGSEEEDSWRMQLTCFHCVLLLASTRPNTQNPNPSPETNLRKHLCCDCAGNWTLSFLFSCKFFPL